MTVLRKVSLTVIVLASLLGSCKKEEQDPTVGTILLNVDVVHHDVPVQSAQVFLKRNASDFPGTNSNVYDESDEATDGRARFTKLLPGQHWLYSIGFDGVDSVVGYMPVVLSDSLRYSEVDVKLYVSE